MKRGVSSSIANIALAVGVVLAMAVAIGFTMRHPASVVQPTLAPAEAAPPKGVIYLRLPPAHRPPKVVMPSRAPLPVKGTALARPAVSASANAPPGLRSSAVEEPFEPPAPPIADAAPPSALLRAGGQVAALPPPEPMSPAPAPVAMSSALAAPVPAAPPPSPAAAPVATVPPPTGTEAPVRVRAGDPVPSLRTVPLESHEIHAVPDRNIPVRPVTVVGREDRDDTVASLDRAVPPARADMPLREARPRHAGPVKDDATAPAEASAPGGPSVSGTGIVTAALELNVDGKPLRLVGVKLPESTDMCTPNAKYAARSCADVTRQALAARVGANGRVTCRILAGGRGPWPAICLNRHGEDLGAYLIKHGFALADATELADYSAIETQARSAHSGLWSYR